MLFVVSGEDGIVVTRPVSTLHAYSSKVERFGIIVSADEDLFVSNDIDHLLSLITLCSVFRTSSAGCK